MPFSFFVFYQQSCFFSRISFKVRQLLSQTPENKKKHDKKQKGKK